jgi:hypothetical protein
MKSSFVFQSCASCKSCLKILIWLAYSDSIVVVWVSLFLTGLTGFAGLKAQEQEMIRVVDGVMLAAVSPAERSNEAPPFTK